MTAEEHGPGAAGAKRLQASHPRSFGTVVRLSPRHALDWPEPGQTDCTPWSERPARPSQGQADDDKQPIGDKGPYHRCGVARAFLLYSNFVPYRGKRPAKLLFRRRNSSKSYDAGYRHLFCLWILMRFRNIPNLTYSALYDQNVLSNLIALALRLGDAARLRSCTRSLETRPAQHWKRRQTEVPI